MLSEAVTAQVDAEIAASQATGDNELTNSRLSSLAGRGGVGSGIGTAGERLADYFISRAEQYQPVISLRGGTLVDVIFIEGVELAPDLIEQAIRPAGFNEGFITNLFQAANDSNGQPFQEAVSIFERH